MPKTLTNDVGPVATDAYLWPGAYAKEWRIGSQKKVLVPLKLRKEKGGPIETNSGKVSRTVAIQYMQSTPSMAPAAVAAAKRGKQVLRDTIKPDVKLDSSEEWQDLRNVRQALVGTCNILHAGPPSVSAWRCRKHLCMLSPALTDETMERRGLVADKLALIQDRLRPLRAEGVRRGDILQIAAEGARVRERRIVLSEEETEVILQKQVPREGHKWTVTLLEHSMKHGKPRLK